MGIPAGHQAYLSYAIIHARMVIVLLSQSQEPVAFIGIIVISINYSFMPAICHKCGSLKQNPIQECSACHAIPRTEDELVMAFMLTDRFLDKEKMITAANMISSGRRIDFPPAVKAAVLAALQSARAQHRPQKPRLNRKGLGNYRHDCSNLISHFPPLASFSVGFNERQSKQL